MHHKLWNSNFSCKSASADVGLFFDAFQNFFFSLQYSFGPTIVSLRLEGTMISEMLYHWCKCSCTWNSVIWIALDPQFACQPGVSISHPIKHYHADTLAIGKKSSLSKTLTEHTTAINWYMTALIVLLHVAYQCATFLVLNPSRSVPFIEHQSY